MYLNIPKLSQSVFRLQKIVRAPQGFLRMQRGSRPRLGTAGVRAHGKGEHTCKGHSGLGEVGGQELKCICDTFIA
jgi:hypothetical protein